MKTKTNKPSTIFKNTNKKMVLGKFQDIYAIVSTIPKGKVMTYKQVATIAKTTPRVVGFAMAGNKDTSAVPCHRVIDSHGKLRGYGYGGIKVKKQLLEHEGIAFLNTDTIDLKKSLYNYK